MWYSALRKNKPNDTSQTQFPYNAPARSNKIYRSDEVFLIEKTQTNDISQTQFPYNAPARSNKIYRSDEVFLIEKN